ncbi:palmitoyltransferase ZDHHC4 [Heteronotia binoei]|uniref:palmitoyltransferase ZDHHC4 n=1 Tax=Heteronotia binoei TaxID=13085 RepID=UPI00292DCB94|nr:palmitoyltransferase ZDHHC4 [Heteronotia binoei]XP_060116711.1 palmitoyltransferase ZDHHC4 [Heteronotia binoei]
MDFLILFLLYVILVLLTILLVCLYSGRKQSWPSRTIDWFAQVLSHVIPSQVHGAAQRVLHRLFHTRHCLFVVLHLALEVLVYGEYTWEVFGYCQELEFGLPLLLLPYLLLTVNMAFFVLCSKTDPGAITKSNQALFLRAYAYDGVMFERGAKCVACSTRKPARSKHCGVCRACVHRFDHHCIWVNNCIGAFNTKYFLVYLLTLGAMATTIAAVTAAFLIQVVTLSNLMLGYYTDDQGQERQVDAFVVIQHLFLTFPRMVFMLGFVIVFAAILSLYFCFGLYLLLINQTSYEWFKSRRFKSGAYTNIYSRGVWGNVMEIAKPLRIPEPKRR